MQLCRGLYPVGIAYPDSAFVTKEEAISQAHKKGAGI